MNVINYSDFEQLEIRVGEVIDIQNFPEGKYSTHILKIDFGETIGIKQSLAKLKPNYKGPELVGKQIIAITNFQPKQIGKHISQVLVLGAPDQHGNVVLLHPSSKVPLGNKIY